MFPTDHPESAVPRGLRLLVSVRDAAEALAAAAGGTDIIDIKEPAHGSLGRASSPVIAEICRVLRSGDPFAGPISAALGELRDLPSVAEWASAIQPFQWVKVGLSGCDRTDWRSAWQRLQQQLVRMPTDCRLIAVVYVDGPSCGAPPLEQILEAALATDTPGVLFDTFEKNGRSLFDSLSPQVLRKWIWEFHAAGRFVALAGSLDRQHLPELVELQPDIIAVRSAVCTGGRTGRVVAEKVAALQTALQQAARGGVNR